MALDNPAIPVQESWKTPTLVNSWSNFGGLFNPAGYWKDSFGVVHLRGLVKDGAQGTVIFTLPTGYRPVNKETFVAMSLNSMGVHQIGRLDIATDGTVNCLVGAATGTTPGFWLDGTTFRAI